MIAYFDCFSGISGDMALGALIDAGAQPAALEAAVAAMGLREEVELSVRREQRGHLGGTRVAVEVREGARRTVPQLVETVLSAGFAPAVAGPAVRALRLLGAAESRIHGAPEADLHLHELGGADTLVDIAGTFALLDALGVRDVYASPLPAPRGWIGELPLPAPASMRVLAGSGATLVPSASGRELVTPTGAAILAAAARFEAPSLQLDAIGYGIGGRDEPGNALAVWIGPGAAEAAEVTVIETNLDDMAPNLLAAVMEDLGAAGALDVSLTPIVMKKGRAGHRLTVVCANPDGGALARRILGSSTALGVRMHRAGRMLAGRRFVDVATPYGTISVKVKLLDGRAVDFAPEYEDCRRAAADTGADLRDVIRAAAEAARAAP